MTEARFSLVYPTRHRPDFIRQALRILAQQRHDRFEVVVCDNYVDPALSCEQICRDSGLANLVYVRPPRPLGMVENWNHALQFSTGAYVSYLTDKMFVLPGALRRIERAIEAAGNPEIVSWISDAYNPDSYADYFGGGQYVRMMSDARPGPYRGFDPAMELNRRGRGEVSRQEQSSSDYCRGKLVFGAYRRDLVERIEARYGALFHSINPDYTSMVLGLSLADTAVELAESCVVSVNTDISNGMLCDTSDAAAFAFLDSLTGGADAILPNMLVPGLYTSVSNFVAHDFVTLKRTFGLEFELSTPNWLVYCHEDIYRPGRDWSDPRVEAEQKQLLAAFVASLDTSVAESVRARIAERATPRERGSARRLLQGTRERRAPRWLRRLVRPVRQRLAPSHSFAAPTLDAAVERRVRSTAPAPSPRGKRDPDVMLGEDVVPGESLTRANAEFWNEPCGTALARSLGITSIDEGSLARFDRSYFEIYPYLRPYLDALNLPKRRVLEVGVGYGSLGQHLAERCASYQGVDIAEEPVGLLQQRLALIGKPTEGVVRGSALDLPIADASVDLFVSIGCLHHTGNIERGVAEAYRVLAPGGRAVVMVYNRHSLRRLINVPTARLRARLGRLAARTPDEAVRRMYDSNLAGAAPPHTDFVSVTEAKALFHRFSRVRVDRRNFDDYRLARGRLWLRRRWFLGWLDRLLGLDLYIVAEK